MVVDLMLVDDEEGVLDATETLAELVVIRKPDELRKLEIIKFYSGIEALEYLRGQTDNLPRGYLVDMRIPHGAEELASSLDIYKFLEQHNATKYFRFYTGHISEHDLEVQRKTGAKILAKGRDSNELEIFLEELARTKPSTTNDGDK